MAGVGARYFRAPDPNSNYDSSYLEVLHETQRAWSAVDEVFWIAIVDFLAWTDDGLVRTPTDSASGCTTFDFSVATGASALQVRYEEYAPLGTGVRRWMLELRTGYQSSASVGVDGPGASVQPSRGELVLRLVSGELVYGTELSGAFVENVLRRYASRARERLRRAVEQLG